MASWPLTSDRLSPQERPLNRLTKFDIAPIDDPEIEGEHVADSGFNGASTGLFGSG
jgi:hypothetical protein